MDCRKLLKLMKPRTKPLAVSLNRLWLMRKFVRLYWVTDRPEKPGNVREKILSGKYA